MVFLKILQYLVSLEQQVKEFNFENQKLKNENEALKQHIHVLQSEVSVTVSSCLSSRDNAIPCFYGNAQSNLDARIMPFVISISCLWSILSYPRFFFLRKQNFPLLNYPFF